MVTLNDTFGAVLVGVIVASILYGFTCVQTWLYYTSYPLDPWYIKLLVAVILVSDTCHQVMISHVVYVYLVTFFGQTEQTEKIVWSMAVQVFFNGFTTLVVQCFLAIRAYRLSNSSWLVAGPIMILVVAEFVSAFVFGAMGLQLETFAQLSSIRALSMTVNVLAAAGDLLIALFLCCMLHTSRTGLRKFDTLISKLVVFSINTGLLTSLCALASLISIVVSPNTFLYIAFYFSIGRLYCNTLLATLNARKGLRGEYCNDDPSLCFQSCNTQPSVSHPMLGLSSKNPPQNISITTDGCVREDTEYSPSGLHGDAKNPEIAV